jgi:hypothetical protein
MVIQLIMDAQSTVDENRLNCLRPLIQLFMKHDPLFIKAGSNVHHHWVNC